jgi:outer membrane protein assembly factor BamB
VAADGVVYVASSYDKQVMLAIHLDGAKGDITGSDQIIWSRNKYTPYVPSPLLYGEMLYFLNHNQGSLTCLNAKTGKKLYSYQRVDGIGYTFASPVGGGSRVYITDRRGTTIVIKHGETYEVLAQNRLDDSFSASPAIVGREMYLRGQQNLYCIAEE